jgi:peptidoglycan/LPS O-acetylase OafA/YrhL
MKTASKLPGLNGLRAIAASLVIFGHVYQIAGLYGIQEAIPVYHRSVGGDMVNLFFVISGFIITYILLREKQATNHISLKNFYIKRILRIWPLYFLIFGAVFILSNFTSVYSGFDTLNSKSVIVFCFFIINFNSFFHFPLSVLPHYWSLSVEEQFYLFWPLLLKRLNPLVTAIVVIIAVVFLRNFAALMSNRGSHQTFWLNLSDVIQQTRFGSMAIGVIGAIMLEKIKRFDKLLFKTPIQIMCWAIFLFSILAKWYIPYIHYEVMALLYLYLILAVTISRKPIISLENRFFDWTGSISYGLYMYHWPLIPVIIVGLKKAGWLSALASFHQIPLLILSYLLTYILASLSFKYFETPFLRLKPKGPVKEKMQATAQSYSI